MVTALLQTLLCALAGAVLWRMWRAFDGESRYIRGVVFLGFMFRAVAGAALFFISYYHLPVARSLQIEHGLWFFAPDAKMYLASATAAAEGGIRAIVMVTRTSPSVTFVQVLGAFSMLFGAVTSVALLVNLFCYMGSSIILLKWRNATPDARVPAAIAITAISLSPAAMLWSLQPLKDTLFQFLMVAYIAACALWQRASHAKPRARIAAQALAALAMIVTMFGLAGIRWYVAFAVLVASGAFLLLSAATAPRKVRALAAAIVVLFILTQAFVISGKPYISPTILNVLLIGEKVEDREAIGIANEVESARDGFERTEAATVIGVGSTLKRFEGSPSDPPVAPPQTAQSSTPKPPASAPRQPAPPTGQLPLEKKPVEIASEPGPEPASKTDVAQIPKPSLAPSSAETSVRHADAVRHVDAPPPQTASAKPAHDPSSTPSPDSSKRVASSATPHAPPPQTTTPVSDAAPAQPLKPPAQTTTTAHSTAAVAPPPASVVPKPSKGAEAKARPMVKTKKRATIAAAPAKKKASEPAIPKEAPKPAPVVAAKPVAPAPAPATPVAEKPQSDVTLPTSHAGRLALGAAAVLLPSSIGRSTGLVEMGGGRGFWWFTDIDTLVFDLMLLIAAVFTFRRLRSASWRNPIFWLVVMVALIGVPLLYVVTNFGTLFRLRLVIYVAAALTPLALSMAPAVVSTKPIVEEELEEAQPPAGVLAEPR